VERVVGIGGTFFRARDAEQLRASYAEHLGFDVQDWGGQALVAKEGDTTVWSIFAGASEYWPAGQQWMLNYRVGDLDAMLEQLRSAGVAVDDKTSEDENGCFGWPPTRRATASSSGSPAPEGPVRCQAPDPAGRG
jgi:predicted enzyme related to lactoylglutathione lyase